jgi:hypothetical protein
MDGFLDVQFLTNEAEVGANRFTSSNYFLGSAKANAIEVGTKALTFEEVSNFEFK